VVENTVNGLKLMKGSIKLARLGPRWLLDALETGTIAVEATSGTGLVDKTPANCAMYADDGIGTLGTLSPEAEPAPSITGL
jgi:hypothetical protein